MKELTLEQKKNIVKRWIPLIYKNDKNNAVFETYNEHCNWKNKTNLKDSLRNIDKIINDEEFVEECVNDLGNLEELLKDISTWGVSDMGINEKLRIVNYDFKHVGYQALVHQGNIYVANLECEEFVCHRNGTITFKDCYLVKDEYFWYDEEQDDFWLNDCGGKEYKITVESWTLKVLEIKKYRDRKTK